MLFANDQPEPYRNLGEMWSKWTPSADATIILSKDSTNKNLKFLKIPFKLKIGKPCLSIANPRH